MRVLGESEEHFDKFKRIIKELCFYGADRSITRKQDDCTPLEILEQGEDELDEEDYNSLHRILSPQRNCMCFMTHRPIEKVGRSPKVLMLGLIMNIFVIFAFLYGIELVVFQRD